jgi:hypothetical protein
MYSTFLKIQQSIDSIDKLCQIPPSFTLIRLFETNFKSVAGVQEKTQLLMKQLREIEL